MRNSGSFLVALLSTNAFLTQVQAAPPLDNAKPAENCTFLFGDQERKTEALDQIQAQAIEVLGLEDQDVFLLHSGIWKAAPKQIAFSGIKLTATGTTAEGQRVGLLEVQTPKHCEKATYAVSAGNTLGPKGRVLAVHDQILLLEYNGKLRYALAEGAPVPNWHVAWRSGWSMAPYQATSSKGGSAYRPSRSKPRSSKFNNKPKLKSKRK